MALFITTYLSLFLTQILLTRAIDACVNATDSLRKEATPYPVLPPKPSTPYTKAFRQYRPSYHLTAPFNWVTISLILAFVRTKSPSKPHQ